MDSGSGDLIGISREVQLEYIGKYRISLRSILVSKVAFRMMPCELTRMPMCPAVSSHSYEHQHWPRIGSIGVDRTGGVISRVQYVMIYVYILFLQRKFHQGTVVETEQTECT